LAKGCFSELAHASARASPDTRDAAVQLLADLFSTGKLKSSEICALLLNAEERARISKITDQNIDSMGSLAVDYEHMHVDQQQRLVRVFDVLFLALCRHLKAGLPDQDGVLGGLLKRSKVLGPTHLFTL
jgi:hypothetical protein